MKRDTGTCVVCGNPFEYIRITKPRSICSYRCELERASGPRKARGVRNARGILESQRDWNRIRRERHAALKAAGVASVECDAAACSARAFEAACAEHGVDARSLHPDLMRGPANPRTYTEKALDRHQRYHALKALGANSKQAAAGAQGPNVFERIKRELEARQ